MIQQFFLDHWEIIVSGSRALMLGFLVGAMIEFFMLIRCLWTGEEF